MIDDEDMVWLKFLINGSLNNISFLKEVLKINTAKSLDLPEQVYQGCIKNINEVEKVLKSFRKNPNQKDMDKKIRRISVITKLIYDRVTIKNYDKNFMN